MVNPRDIAGEHRRRISTLRSLLLIGVDYEAKFSLRIKKRICQHWALSQDTKVNQFRLLLLLQFVNVVHCGRFVILVAL